MSGLRFLHVHAFLDLGAHVLCAFLGATQQAALTQMDRAWNQTSADFKVELRWRLMAFEQQEGVLLSDVALAPSAAGRAQAIADVAAAAAQLPVPVRLELPSLPEVPIIPAPSPAVPVRDTSNTPVPLLPLGAVLGARALAATTPSAAPVAAPTPLAGVSVAALAPVTPFSSAFRPSPRYLAALGQDDKPAMAPPVSPPAATATAAGPAKGARTSGALLTPAAMANPIAEPPLLLSAKPPKLSSSVVTPRVRSATALAGATSPVAPLPPLSAVPPIGLGSSTDAPDEVVSAMWSPHVGAAAAMASTIPQVRQCVFEIVN